MNADNFKFLALILVIALSFAPRANADDVDQIMQKYANATTALSTSQQICTATALYVYDIRTNVRDSDLEWDQITRPYQDRIQKVTSYIQRNDFVQASSIANLYAEGFSKCYFNMQQKSKAEFAGAVGTLIGLNVISSEKWRGDTDKLAAQDAATLLSFGKPGSPLLAEMNKRIGTSQPAQNTDLQFASTSLTAFQVVEELNSNKARFGRKYKGETMSINGKITSIYDASDMVIVKLQGTNKHVDDRRLNESISCHIPKGTPSYNRIIDYDKGQTISVIGLFKDFGIGGAVVLQGCSLQLG